jgi:hypothetical protein
MSRFGRRTARAQGTQKGECQARAKTEAPRQHGLEEAGGEVKAWSRDEGRVEKSKACAESPALPYPRAALPY